MDAAGYYFDELESADDQLRAEGGKTRSQLPCRFIRLDRKAFGQDLIARVEPLCHVHDRDAGFRFAVKDRILHRRGAAVFRQ